MTLTENELVLGSVLLVLVSLAPILLAYMVGQRHGGRAIQEILEAKFDHDLRQIDMAAKREREMTQLHYEQRLKQQEEYFHALTGTPRALVENRATPSSNESERSAVVNSYFVVVATDGSVECGFCRNVVKGPALACEECEMVAHLECVSNNDSKCGRYGCPNSV